MALANFFPPPLLLPRLKFAHTPETTVPPKIRTKLKKKRFSKPHTATT